MSDNPKRLDLSNRKFGRLTAIRSRVGLLPWGKRVIFWLMRCDCGKMKVIWISNLISGNTRSCGCLQSEAAKVLIARLHPGGEEDPSYIHGHAINGKTSPTYSSYHNIISRCENPNSTGYHRYGGRGIKVCNRWKEDFLTFLADMGERPVGTDIHRKNNNGNYEPSNCLWINQRRHNLFHAKERSAK